MNWTLFSIFLILVAIAVWVWYSVKRVAKSDQIEQDAKEAEEALKRVQNAAIKTELEIREKEKKDAEEIAKSGDAHRAGELLRDSFKGDN